MDTNLPLVSVCIVSYNHERFIEYCINSIENQDYKNIEILVLDDGSKDNSIEILQNLKSKSSYPFEIIAQENSGCIGANFNKLIHMANGKYLVIMAADDALFPNSISKKIDIMEKDASIQYVINSRIQRIDENNNLLTPITKLDIPLDSIENPTALEVLELEYENVHSYFLQGGLYRKSIIDVVGGFDEDMIADDIILRTKLSRYIIDNPNLKFVTLHEAACYYRKHTSSISANMIRQIKSVALYFNKYWGERKYSDRFISWIDRNITKNPEEVYNLASEIAELKPYINESIKKIKSKKLNVYLKYLYNKILSKITFGSIKEQYKKESKKLHKKVRIIRKITSLTKFV